MHRFLFPVIALLLGLGAAHAQNRQMDCSSSRNPAKCEELREKTADRREQAEKACEGKSGDEHRKCMADSFCSTAPDPAKCKERLKERAAKRQ